ncbi:MAG TPA: Gfo/Idh/MocA family oxidoreductase [Allosphingosinicella sp.]|jgi:D-galactose 1-dehydrogenase|nr:Gfo/Idh/MocA family oxidoreductase [Allosphingosinicella sp.]
MPIRIAIVGYGKIAKDQHVPSIAADPRFVLAAVVSPRAPADAGVPVFPSTEKMLAAMAGELDAVAICTPPTVRLAIAQAAFAAGLDVLLEKPPAATLGEIEEIERLGREAGRTLFTAWHSQHAPAVAAARAALAGKTVRALQISWHEDVRKWHPGQEWIWAPGGFGVFDPGINALSIATRILPSRLFVREAVLSFPENRQTPIAARIAFEGESGRFAADMDWRYTEGERWTIRIETVDGAVLELLDGGARITLDGEPRPVGELGEYPSLYARFAELVEAGGSDVDREPLRIVADAFLVGQREMVEPFL